uniref:Uncharacterized protein n=1 Tax=Strigamia maritima TaxID=126957 RepID=T1J1U5_STRMM
METLKELREKFPWCSEADRLKSFNKWPYQRESKCTPVEMARAGFYCPDEKFADLAKCFVCDKELDGWEIGDVPWHEHESHSPNCPFIKLGKTESEMKVDDFLKLACETSTFKIVSESSLSQIKRLID